jgi:serine/threonine-protein kinase
MQIGEFTLESRIRRGSTGEVWRGAHIPTGKKVIVKFFSAETNGVAEKIFRLNNEAMLFGRLRYPGAPEPVKAGMADGMAYIALSPGDGECLMDILKRQKVLPESAALRHTKDIACFLEFAWEKHRVVHRNVKPSNIFISSDGRAAIFDMSLAKSASDNMSISRKGLVLGTRGFMSPEQEEGLELDHRSDIFTLGLNLCVMVTGLMPGDDWSGQAAGVSGHCAALIAKMTAGRKEDRQRTWREAIDDINAVMEGRSPAANRPAPPPGSPGGGAPQKTKQFPQNPDQYKTTLKLTSFANPEKKDAPAPRHGRTVILKKRV